MILRCRSFSRARCSSPGFAQCLAEGDVLYLRLGGQAGAVGRHEGEGLVGIAAVFRQIEMHPTDQVPCPIQGGQEICMPSGRRVAASGNTGVMTATRRFAAIPATDARRVRYQTMGSLAGEIGNGSSPPF